VGNSPEGDFKNSVFHTFSLYSHNALGTALDVKTICDDYDNEVFNNIPYLDVTAVLNEADNKVIINVVNRHETDAIETNIDLQSGEYTGKATANVINAESIDTRNTKDAQPVQVESEQVSFKGNTLLYSFPAHSFTQIEIPIK
jgi:alpha-N-arabinofuranosidase